MVRGRIWLPEIPSELGYPWGHLLPLLHHHSPSGDSSLAKKTDNKRLWCWLSFITQEVILLLSNSYKYKNICNIWWDLPATHVIKTARCFYVVNCVVNVTLAHYIKKKHFLLFLTLYDLPSLPHSTLPFGIFFTLLAFILTFIQLTWNVFFSYE